MTTSIDPDGPRLLRRGMKFTPSDEQLRSIEEMAAYGVPFINIADVIGISVSTLTKRCAGILSAGRRRGAKVENLPFDNCDELNTLSRYTERGYELALSEECDALVRYPVMLTLLTLRESLRDRESSHA